MTAVQDSKRLRGLMDDLLRQAQTAVEQEKNDRRKVIFLKLIASLAKSVALHLELQKLEGEERFKISKRHMAKLRNTHHKALGMFVTIPAASKSSLYEMCTILAMADVLAAHSGDDASDKTPARCSRPLQ